jgi:hypothetical protein
MIDESLAEYCKHVCTILRHTVTTVLFYQISHPVGHGVTDDLLLTESKQQSHGPFITRQGILMADHFLTLSVTNDV